MNISELDFKPHSAGMRGTAATIFFPNGYGASVVTGAMFYTSENAPYELAVLKGSEGDSDLTYDTPITSDVLGHLTALEVEETLDKIKNLGE